jgi:hypothetical protein
VRTNIRRLVVRSMVGMSAIASSAALGCSAEIGDNSGVDRRGAGGRWGAGSNAGAGAAGRSGAPATPGTSGMSGAAGARAGGTGAGGTGAGGTGAGGTGPGGTGGTAGTPGTQQCVTPSAPQVPEVGVRRLSRVEYDNTLRDLGLAAADAHIAVKNFAGDSVVGGAKRGYLIGGPIDNLLARDFVDAATTLAATAVQDLPKLLGCVPTNATQENDCARAFISSFGERAFRRPLLTTEVDELFQVFEATRASFDFRTGIEATLASLLAAPEFINLVESSPAGSKPGDIVAVDGLALASRLSYFLWDSTPDAQLLAAAKSGALATPKQVESEARRMLDDARSRDAVNHFLHEWSFIEELAGMPKDAAQFGWYTPELAANLKASFLTSLESAFFSPASTLTAFLAPETMFANAAIANAYGLPQVAGTQLSEVKVDPKQRRGLLTHPALLALTGKPSRSDPIHRGLFVRGQLLCTDLPDPPDRDANGNPIDFNVPPPAPGVSNRERFRQHTASGVCSGCHAFIDPIGFGFENYDAVGRYRTIDENAAPIDASGEVKDGGDVTGAFNGAVELADRVMKSDTVAKCMTLQWFRFALGRRETAADACSNEAVAKRFLESGKNLKEMVIALAVSDAFRYRKVGMGERGMP